MSGSSEREALVALAHELGVITEYWDVGGSHHEAGGDALAAVIRALGHDDCTPVNAREVTRRVRADGARQVLPPTVVHWQGEDLRLPVRLPTASAAGTCRVAVRTEEGEVRVLGVVDLGTAPATPIEGAPSYREVSVTVPAPDLPLGRHEVWLSLPGGDDAHRPLLSAPRTAHRLDDQARLWGVFAPLYAMRTGGAGPSVRDLDRLGRWIAPAGGRVVGTLPLLALFLGGPVDPSPYSPISRCFWSELYLDLDADSLGAGVDGSPIRRWLEIPAVRAALAQLAEGDRYDYAAAHRLRSEAMAALAVHVEDRAWEERDGYDPAIADYAWFRAAVDRAGTGWRAWPAARQRARGRDLDADPVDARMHEIAQHVLRAQLAATAGALGAREQRLYLDLPIGTHPDGYDTFVQPHLFADGVSAGAPPDEFFTKGQDWGFPPLLPHASRAEGHRYLGEVLRHHMETAGILRIDHVMGLHRLFWVPAGMDATDGVYVRYPTDELFALVSLASHRYDCVVIGEDLGTVPDEVREAMAEHRVSGMYVAQFGVPPWAGAEPATPPGGALASVDTHDTPTFAAWRHGLDIDRLHLSGLYDDDVADRERTERRQQVANLAGFLTARGYGGPAALDGAADDGDREGAGAAPGGADDRALHAALLAWLGDTDAAILLVALEDLWGEVEPQNVPGTPADRPNWVHRLRYTLAEMQGDREIAAVFAAVQAHRLGSHGRAREEGS